MQYDGNPKWAKPIPGRWEVALPEGLYDITVSVGDAQVFDGLHRMSAEGVTLIGGFTPTASTPFATGRARVRVSDGKLTLSAAGGTNTRINYVDIDRIEALRKVNFQDELAPTPSGYLRDFGLPYDTSRGYGWIAQDSNTPISLVGNGRDRNLVTDQRFDTFMHMQYPGGPPSGTTTPGRWEMAVAPGVYDITVAVGDPDTTILDSNHRVLVEGIAAIPFFTPDGVNQHQVATVRLNVVDGKVTLDAAGGTNTKIDYVEVNPAEGTVDAPEIDLVSPDDNLLLGTRLVFSTVKQEARPAKTLTVTNTGAGPLNVSNLSFVGPNAADYRLAAGQPTSFSVAPGDSQPVSVEFLPGAGGVERYASLVIASNDSDEATLDVPLRGLNAVDYEGNFEPSLQVITRTIGYGTTIGAESNYISNIRVPKGDEIISPYWKRVDPTKPVTLLPLAHYSGRNTSPVGYTGWHVKGTSTKNTLYAFPGGSDISGGENQRLLPNITPGGTTQFSTDSIFGIFVDNDWSDDGKNFPNKIHNFRFYPAKSPTGAVIPNAWLVGADIGSDASSTVKNYDYNDEAYLMANVEPELQAAAMPGVNALDLPFTAPVPETVVDKDGEGTGFTGVQANNAGDQHQPALVDLDPSTGHLKITSTAGHNSGATNTQLNALEVGFDGTRKDHQTHVRLIGPFTNMTAATQFQGIYMGPDKDNFVKLEVEFRNGQTHLVLYQELAGTGSLPVTPIPIPAGASTVDLYLTGDLGGGRLTASYRVDSNDRSAIQPFGPAITLGDPLKWFSRQSRAGVVVANQGNTLPFTATMDDFWVKVFTTGYSSTAWTTRTPAPVQRLEAQGTAFEDKLYVFGGYTDTTFVPSTRLDIYDPVTNAWTAGAPLPIGTTHAGVTIVGREIWLAGGYIDNGSGGQIFATTNVWKYNVDTNTWAAGPPLPEARGSGGLVALGGNVHFFGGGDTARADRGHHWMLPAGGSTWVSKAVLPNSRSHMGYVAFGGKVWAIGGQKGNDASLVTQATVNSYDPVANTWTTMASLPGGRSHISGSTLVRDGLILMIGGETAHGSQISNVLAYDPAGNIWREQQRMPNARYSSVAGILGGDIYVATGSMKNTLFRGVPTAAAPTTPS
jgi:N-acetylneuraminic acid mutarotase